MATLQSTLNELHTLNQITNNVAVAGITFDAIQLVEDQEARITELAAHITEFKRDARAAAIADRDKIAELEDEELTSLEMISTQLLQIAALESNQAERDIEMKMNGVNEFVNLMCGDCTNEYAYYLNEAAIKYMGALRKQEGGL